jgi:NAD(P)H-dependent FMN reductase
VAPDGIECHIYAGLAALPAFNPDEDQHPLHREVARLRDAIHGAHAIIFSTPEYAGALPGSLKNLLDWTIGDDQNGSIYNKPVCWLNASPRGADAAHEELHRVLGYAHARIIDAACAHVAVTATMIGADGLIEDRSCRVALTFALAALATEIAPA